MCLGQWKEVLWFHYKPWCKFFELFHKSSSFMSTARFMRAIHLISFINTKNSQKQKKTFSCLFWNKLYLDWSTSTVEFLLLLYVCICIYVLYSCYMRYLLYQTLLNYNLIILLMRQICIKAKGESVFNIFIWGFEEGCPAQTQY